MKLVQIRGEGALPEFARKRLEEVDYMDVELARQDLQDFFPNHLVREENGHLRVAVRDNSFIIAEFREIV